MFHKYFLYWIAVNIINVEHRARCSSAAPWFFKTKALDSIGSFQDGGLTHNNPAKLSLYECANIWPNSSVDLLLSIGTGTKSQTLTNTTGSQSLLSPSAIGFPESRGLFQDTFLPRIFRSFMESMDGQKTWYELLNEVNPESLWRFHRLNVNLTEAGNELEAEIDNPAVAGKILALSRFQIQQHEILRIANCLYASLFYFELTQAPYEAEPSVWYCTGAIYCRVPEDRLKQISEYQIQKGYRIYLGANEIRSSCFLKHRIAVVDFTVDSIFTPFPVLLRSDSSDIQISGSPFTISSLIQQQWPETPFGNLQHMIYPIVQKKRSLPTDIGINKNDERFYNKRLRAV